MFFTACKKIKKDENVGSNGKIENTISFLKSNFEISEIDTNSNISASQSQNRNKSIDTLTAYQNTINDLDFSKVTKIKWKNETTTFVIPFKSDLNKKVVINVLKENENEPLDYNKALIIDFNVNPETGDGEIIYTKIDGTIIQDIDDGNLRGEKALTASTDKPAITGAQPVKKPPLTYNQRYTRCMDRTYNDICNDAVGCFMYYTNPLVIATAAAYCSLTV